MPRSKTEYPIIQIGTDVRRPYTDYKEYYRLMSDCGQEEALRLINDWAHEHHLKGYLETDFPLIDRVSHVYQITGAWEFIVIYPFKD